MSKDRKLELIKTGLDDWFEYASVSGAPMDDAINKLHQSVVELIDASKDKLLTKEQKKANYATHKTRYSDSSLYDEVCEVCGATDYVGSFKLNQPCPGKRQND